MRILSSIVCRISSCRLKRLFIESKRVVAIHFDTHPPSSLSTWISIGFCWASNSNLNGSRFTLFLLPSVCADDPPGEDFSRPCCGEVGLVHVSLSLKEKYEWTPPLFEPYRIFCPKKLMTVVGACVLVFWSFSIVGCWSFASFHQSRSSLCQSQWFRPSSL